MREEVEEFGRFAGVGYEEDCVVLMGGVSSGFLSFFLSFLEQSKGIGRGRIFLL